MPLLHHHFHNIILHHHFYNMIQTSAHFFLPFPHIAHLLWWLLNQKQNLDWPVVLSVPESSQSPSLFFATKFNFQANFVLIAASWQVAFLLNSYSTSCCIDINIMDIWTQSPIMHHSASYFHSWQSAAATFEDHQCLLSCRTKITLINISATTTTASIIIIISSSIIAKKYFLVGTDCIPFQRPSKLSVSPSQRWFFALPAKLCSQMHFCHTQCFCSLCQELK